MIESLKMTFDRLISEVSLAHYRFLYYSFNLNNRLTALIGARGVGKTTLMLQYIKNHYSNLGEVFYFSADHIHFRSTTLYEFVEHLFLNESVETVFIDEIHKYDNWNQELKNLYDSFPKIKIVFSGSSSLDLVKGSYDLSRRAKIYHLPGLSFREYLNFTQNRELNSYGFNELMGNYLEIAQTLSKIPKLLSHFHSYLKQGFYPFFQEDPLSYYEKLLMVVEKTIYEDIANFYNIKTGNLKQFGKILNYLASIPPGKISTYNLSRNLSIDDKTIAGYLRMLQETGLIEIIYPAETGTQGLRKPEKVFFSNTNLHYAIGGHMANSVDIGTIRELAFIQALKNAGIEIFHNKQSDYEVKQFVYEIGGKNKTSKQIKALKNAFLVKDDIVMASQGIIPLVFFGFLY